MKLTQAFKKQDLKVSAIEQKISEDLDSLCNNEISLNSMLEHDDPLLVYMTSAVDNVYAKTVNFRPSIDDFNDLVVKVDVQPNAALNFKQLLTESQNITFDTLRDEIGVQENQNPSSMAILSANQLVDDKVFKVKSELVSASEDD